MTCEGCSNTVQKVLNKFQGFIYNIFWYYFISILILLGKGIDKINIDLKNQKVEVTSTLTSDEILNIIKKTGKDVVYVKST